VLEDADSANVVTTGDEDGSTVVELDNTVNLSVFKVELDGVVLLDVGVGETDGSSVVGDDVWDLVLTHALSLDLAKLEGGFLGLDSVGHEASLDVVEHAEVLTGLVDGNNILEANGVLGVTSDLVVDSDVVGTLVTDDLDDLLAGESVLKSVLEENGHRDALTELVGTLGGAGSVDTSELVKTPVGGSVHALQVLLGTSCL
jgi:hypothetical protein